MQEATKQLGQEFGINHSSSKMWGMRGTNPKRVQPVTNWNDHILRHLLGKSVNLPWLPWCRVSITTAVLFLQSAEWALFQGAIEIRGIESLMLIRYIVGKGPSYILSPRALTDVKMEMGYWLMSSSLPGNDLSFDYGWETPAWHLSTMHRTVSVYYFVTFFGSFISQLPCFHFCPKSLHPSLHTEWWSLDWTFAILWRRCFFLNLIWHLATLDLQVRSVLPPPPLILF